MTNKKTIHKTAPNAPVKSDPKIEALLQKYELPKTIFYHATESQILKLLKHQALHHRLLAEAHSPMKQFNDNRLNAATEKRRKLYKTELQRKWTDNIGVPMSVKSTLSKSDLIEFIFRLYRDQASLAKIKNGHSQYSQHFQSNPRNRNKNKNKKGKKTFSEKTKHEQFRETTKRTKKRRQMAYDTLRKVVFDSYASGTKNKVSRVSYLVPPRRKTSTTSSSRRRSLKSGKNKSQTTLFSKNLKSEVEKLCQKKDETQKKRTQIRLVQSARKHKPDDINTVKKLNDGSFTTRTARKSVSSYSNDIDSQSQTIVDKILSIAHTKEANEKYGNTVPAFRAAFVQEMYQYSKQKCQQNKNSCSSERKIQTNKKFQPRKPQFKCPVGAAKVFTGRRASAFSQFGKKESDFDESTFVRRHAYDKMVKNNINIKNSKVPQLNLQHVNEAMQ